MALRSPFRAGVVDGVRRILWKTVVGPLKYRRGDGYDAARYWSDRFAKYGASPRASGDEGLSQEENERLYREAVDTVVGAAVSAGVDLPAARVLDVGCGPGFLTAGLADAGVRDYTGVDITDTLFGDLRQRFPDYRFVRADVTEDEIEGAYDLVALIDVLFHIVEPARFQRCLETLRGALRPGGVLLVGALDEQPRRGVFYVRFWSADDVRAALSDLVALEPVPYREGWLLRFRRDG